MPLPTSEELHSLVTIVMTQRERFSTSAGALTALFETIPGDVPVVFVDGASDPDSQRAVQIAAASHPTFMSIRKEHYLPQNAAYNLALEHVDTPYIAFIDNDIRFHPDWLPLMLETAMKHHADVVSPLYLEKVGNVTLTHMAGGLFKARRKGEKLEMIHNHLCAHRPRAEAESLTPVTTTDLIEYHAFLIKKSAVEQIGGFDTGFLNAKDHEDLCLCIKNIGGTIFSDRRVWVEYQVPPPLDKDDVHFFTTRWSEDWTERSYHHFRKKWALTNQAPEFFGQQRRLFLFRYLAPLQHIIGYRNARRLYFRIFDPLLAPVEKQLNERMMRNNPRVRLSETLPTHHIPSSTEALFHIEE